MGEAVSTPATIYFFDLAHEKEALALAKEIANKTGKAITVRDADGEFIETVTPTKH